MPTKGSKAVHDGQKKKYTRFRVYEILNDYTNGDNHLKHTEIQEKLESEYNICIERKNIRECIDDINFLGEPYGIIVNSEKGDGAFLLQRMFEKSEVKIWECRNCGHIVIGTKAPEVCPVCAHPQSYFEVRKENY